MRFSGIIILIMMKWASWWCNGQYVCVVLDSTLGGSSIGRCCTQQSWVAAGSALATSDCEDRQWRRWGVLYFIALKKTTAMKYALVHSDCLRKSFVCSFDMKNNHSKMEAEFLNVIYCTLVSDYWTNYRCSALLIGVLIFTFFFSKMLEQEYLLIKHV